MEKVGRQTGKEVDWVIGGLIDLVIRSIGSRRGSEREREGYDTAAEF